jgi:hypothetical protein
VRGAKAGASRLRNPCFTVWAMHAPRSQHATCNLITLEDVARQADEEEGNRLLSAAFGFGDRSTVGRSSSSSLLSSRFGKRQGCGK